MRAYKRGAYPTAWKNFQLGKNARSKNNHGPLMTGVFQTSVASISTKNAKNSHRAMPSIPLP